MPEFQRAKQCTLLPPLPAEWDRRQAPPFGGRLEAEPPRTKCLRHALGCATLRAGLHLEDLPSHPSAICTAAHRHGTCGVWAPRCFVLAEEYMHRSFLKVVACVTVSACAR